MSRAADVFPSTTAGRRLTVAAVAAVGLAIAAGIVLAGRLERRQWIDEQLRGMARVQRAVGPLDQKSLIGYRVLPIFDCLVYRRGADPYALELCFDQRGRLVEAIDRRPRERKYYSLRAEPTASTIVVPRAEVTTLLRRMQAPPVAVSR
jgi:hypothetical protein